MNCKILCASLLMNQHKIKKLRIKTQIQIKFLNPYKKFKYNQIFKKMKKQNNKEKNNIQILYTIKNIYKDNILIKVN